MRAKQFERRRAALGITKKRLAELAEVDESCLGRFLNGRTRAFERTEERISKALARQEALVLDRLGRRRRRRINHRRAA